MSKILMFDFETLDSKPSAVVLALAGVVFDFENHDTFQDLIKSRDRLFYSKISVGDQVGRTISQPTLDWWAKQSPEAKEILKPLEDDDSVSDCLGMFKQFCDSHGIGKYSQGFVRGQSFDFPIMRSLVEQYCPEYETNGPGNWPVSFWNQNDTRTALRYMFCSPSLRNIPVPKGTFDGFIQHNPIHDICKDVILLQTAFRYATGTEDMPEEYDLY